MVIAKKKNIGKRLFVFGAALFLLPKAQADYLSDTAPYRLAGQTLGFVVMSKGPGTAKFSDAGIKSDDVVLSINGRRIRSDKDARKAYNEKSIGKAVVLRNGERVFIKKDGGK